MCGCSTHQSGEAGKTVIPQAGNLTLKVDDMTCGHCADTIKTAVESALPGALANPDPATKLVTIAGTADLNSVKAAILAAGYTPSAA
ncbi:heavy-metal-associated domain-containing protein [Microvirga brassicacearum]|uniref:Heavy-metal-associated domain-containing protein n=1 Tax=Microvirga brassicacearum TaxID=2580413 RepID=A0A5N3P4D9_9HYPH|nr:heavy-metal-associated domain-containing protein [Microvirga brassicacearum]KAB0264584.1 heavy-metal-associated domain-containing protein [Microvirga brassicacearum]